MHTVIKQRTDVGFVKANEGSGRGSIGIREDRVQFKEAMAGKSDDWDWKLRAESKVIQRNLTDEEEGMT